MATQNYYVVGGEYSDTSFTTPLAELTVRGPFNEREAKVCWRELTSHTIDNAMVRYFLKSEDEVTGKNFWVIGGEYADSSFTRMRGDKELEVYGPFDKWEEALGFWRGLTSKSIDDAMVRYDVRENYQPGDGVPTSRIAGGGNALQHSVTKTIAVAAAPDKVFAYVADGGHWPKWASKTFKSAKADKPGIWSMDTPRGTATLTIKADAASGVIDHTLRDGAGTLHVPGRVVGAGGGAVLMMTFTKPSHQSESQFSLDMRQVDDELAALKRILES